MKLDVWKEHRPGQEEETCQHLLLTDTKHADAFFLAYLQKMETYSIDPQYCVSKLMLLFDRRNTHYATLTTCRRQERLLQRQVDTIGFYGIGPQAFRFCWQQLKLKTGVTCYELVQRA